MYRTIGDRENLRGFTRSRETNLWRVHRHLPRQVRRDSYGQFALLDRRRALRFERVAHDRLPAVQAIRLCERVHFEGEFRGLSGLQGLCGERSM